MGHATVLPLLLAALAGSHFPALALPTTAPSAEQDSPPQVTAHPFVESAVVVGGETQIPDYRESAVRLHTEFGLELKRAQADSLIGSRLGLVASISPGREDFRSAFGLRATYPLATRLALQATFGPLFSTERDGRGIQTRIGLRLPGHISIVALWQRVTFAASDSEPSAVVHSLYGGAMLQDAYGGYFSVLMWTAVAIAGSIALHALAENLRGLN